MAAPKVNFFTHKLKDLDQSDVREPVRNDDATLEEGTL